MRPSLPELRPSRPLVIGIAGGSASGKSTISRRLAEALSDCRVELVPMDRYFLPTKPQTVAPFSGVTYDDYNQPASFDTARLLADLDALTAGEAPPDVVIVEGLLVLQDDGVRERLDLRLFVDARSDERIVRRLRRNMARGLSFDEIADYFIDSVRFRHDEFVEPSRWHADLVLNGSSGSPQGLEVVLSWIRDRLATGGSSQKG